MVTPLFGRNGRSGDHIVDKSWRASRPGRRPFDIRGLEARIVSLFEERLGTSAPRVDTQRIRREYGGPAATVELPLHVISQAHPHATPK